VLHYLPLAILPRSTAGEKRYLMEDFALAYLPAAAALVNGERPNAPENSVFALAPARARLQYAGAEARSIAEYFPSHRLVLQGSRATEGAFKRQADHYSVIHLATHGFFNRLNPLLSGVELEPDRDEDGRLEVHEILGLRFHARLVNAAATTNRSVRLHRGDYLPGRTGSRSSVQQSGVWRSGAVVVARHERELPDLPSSPKAACCCLGGMGKIGQLVTLVIVILATGFRQSNCRRSMLVQPLSQSKAKWKRDPKLVSGRISCQTNTCAQAQEQPAPENRRSRKAEY
jgi:CHAT domain